MTATLDPVRFEAPLVNPSPAGLYAATSWTDDAGPNRWLAGVQIRPHNYGGDAAFGVWTPDWDADSSGLTETDIKTGPRPDFLDAFKPVVMWGYDEYYLADQYRVEVRERAQQNLRLGEQNAVESAFAVRAKTDAGTATEVADLVAAVGALEAALAKTTTIGMIHASPGLAAAAAWMQLLIRSGPVLRTPLGHLWVFGGGYVDGLANTLVATSPTYGWRSTTNVVESIDTDKGVLSATAERAVLVGYEHAIGAATITPPSP